MTLREQFDAAMSAAMLRHGILGTIPKYAVAYMPDPDSYREMGLDVPAAAGERYPSLDEARCTVCGAGHRVDNIDGEDEYYGFGSSIPSPCVFGYMTCTAGCDNGVRVVYNGTYVELIDLALSLADSVD